MSISTQHQQPLILNNVFENVFGLYRTSFGKLFAIVAVAQAPLVALQLLLLVTLGAGLPDNTATLVRRLLARPLLESAAPDLPLGRLVLFAVASLALWLLAATLVNQLVVGALTNVIVRQHLRERVTVVGAYRLGWRGARALLAAGLVASLVGLAIAGVGLLVGWGVVVALPFSAALFGGVLLVGATGLVLLLVLIRFLFFPQVIVVEGLGALAALRRSWGLTGSALLRVIGSVALVWMLVLIATGIPTACINFGVQFIFPHPVDDLFVRQVVSLFVSVIVQMAVLPLQLSAYTMLYFDLRRRGEGHAQGYE